MYFYKVTPSVLALSSFTSSASAVPEITEQTSPFSTPPQHTQHEDDERGKYLNDPFPLKSNSSYHTVNKYTCPVCVSSYGNLVTLQQELYEDSVPSSSLLSTHHVEQGV